MSILVISREPILSIYFSCNTLRSLTWRSNGNGQQSVIAVDIINLMDAHKIEKAIIAGFDWGAPTANIIF
jgi:pimeloyl-ACP methyl ester carboxylesterase